MLSAALLRGYAATTYGVTAPDGTFLALRLDAPSPAADRLLRQFGARNLCCVNAWNPLSRRRVASRNMAAHLRLRRDLARRGLLVLPHTGVPDSPRWSPEPGFAVFDLDEKKAIRLAEAYGQLGLVFYRIGGRAALLLTRHAMK